MTRRALYYADKNQLVERPGIEKPIEPKQGLARSSYDLAMGMYKEACIKYNVHLASLRTINCHSSCKGLWPDKSLLEEGREYEVRVKREYMIDKSRWLTPVEDMGNPFEDGEFMAFPLPVKSEDDRTGIFPVQRLTNGAGHSNLTIVTEEAITDIFIGSVLLVPFVNGYKDPKEVKVVVDDHGKPVATKLRTCIVTEYIFN